MFNCLSSKLKIHYFPLTPKSIILIPKRDLQKMSHSKCCRFKHACQQSYAVCHSKIYKSFLLPSEYQNRLARNFTLSTTHLITRMSNELIVKPNLVTTKLNPEDLKSILTPELENVVALFERHGYEIRLVGGAVRDLLANKVPYDIDLATTATPSQMKEMFTAEEIRMISENGEAHGTISIRLNDKENFEISTLRIDRITIEGSKSHKEIEYITDWMLDANRRDLTINSMSLDMKGTVYDYFNGLEDLKHRNICFVGDSEQRIQEDFLRIIRYFRFYGQWANGPNDHSQHTLDVIRKNVHGLENTNGNRIWAELTKIMECSMFVPILETMMDVGIGEYMGLSKDLDEFKSVCKRTEGVKVQRMTRLAALLKTEDDVYAMLDKLGVIPNKDLALALFIVAHREDDMGDDHQAYCRELLMGDWHNLSKVRVYLSELMKYRGHIKLSEEVLTLELPRVPITKEDIVKRGFRSFNVVVSRLRRVWVDSKYTLSRDELLDKLPEIEEDLKMTNKLKQKKGKGSWSLNQRNRYKFNCKHF